MPNKAYAILLSIVNDDDGYLYFPLKRDGLVYGGMPQFFGGTVENGESDAETIARELSEESDQKITLEAGGLKKIYSGNVGGSSYNFYVAQNYSGQNFLGPLDNSEMAKIEKYFVQIGQQDSVDDLLHILGIPPTQAFVESETYQAFDCAIKWSEGNNYQQVDKAI